MYTLDNGPLSEQVVLSTCLSQAHRKLFTFSDKATIGPIPTKLLANESQIDLTGFSAIR